MTFHPEASADCKPGSFVALGVSNESGSASCQSQVAIGVKYGGSAQIRGWSRSSKGERETFERVDQGQRSLLSLLSIGLQRLVCTKVSFFFSH